MNKNNIERPKKFNQKEYYKHINVLCKPVDTDLIADYCKDNGISSKSAYIIVCVKYCMYNNIDVM